MHGGIFYSIRLHEINSSSETLAIESVDDDTSIEKLTWSENGQLLGAATTYGSVLVFLSSLPMLASAYLNLVYVLTNLSQITIYAYSLEKVRHCRRHKNYSIFSFVKCVKFSE